jgi:hypothetical protein
LWFRFRKPVQGPAPALALALALGSASALGSVWEAGSV